MVFKTGTTSRSFKIMSSLSFKVIFFNWHYLFRLKWLVSFPKGYIIWYIFNVQIAIIFSFYISRKWDTAVSLFCMNFSIFFTSTFEGLITYFLRNSFIHRKTHDFLPRIFVYKMHAGPTITHIHQWNYRTYRWCN